MLKYVIQSDYLSITLILEIPLISKKRDNVVPFLDLVLSYLPLIQTFYRFKIGSSKKRAIKTVFTVDISRTRVVQTYTHGRTHMIFRDPPTQ